MWPYYKLLPELPPPPQKFVDAVKIDPANLPSTTPYHEVRIRWSTRNGEQFLASKAARVPLSEEFEQWVRENILPNFNDAGVNYRHFNSDTGGVHTDTTRDYTLNWNITQGGPRCGVTWWQEKGKPMYRTRGIQHLDFDVLEPLHDVEGPMGTWFLLDSRILHSVERIEGEPRVQLAISLDERDVPEQWLLPDDWL